MNAVLGQRQLDISTSPSRFFAASSRLAVLSTGFAVIGLWMAAPVFGQAAPTSSNLKQDLTCITEGQRLVCDVKQPVQTLYQAMAFEQKPSQQASETVELAQAKRTALFNPKLDELFANVLLWTFYLSLPVSVIVAIWRYDRHAREQMVKMLQHVATLERIWQHPQAPQGKASGNY